MNISDIAKKVREAVMNRAENDGRVFHADAIEDEVTKILRAEYPPTNVWGYGTNLSRQDAPPIKGEALADVVNRMRVERGYSPMTSQTPCGSIDVDGTRMPVFMLDTSHDYTSWATDEMTWSGTIVYLPEFPATCTVNGRVVTGQEAEQVMSEALAQSRAEPDPTEWR